MSTFNYSSVSAQLPPNTGAAGTVPITGGNGGSTSSNKNLSHVPCKFYRQGICQAGSTCPFSHNFDGTLAADKLPCKYFQKGNCKFGLKCALAHFLPDGTRVNPRSKRPSHSGYGGPANMNGNYRRSSNNIGNARVGDHTSQPIDITAESLGFITSKFGTGFSSSSTSNMGSTYHSNPEPGNYDLAKVSAFSPDYTALPNYGNGNFRSYSTNTSPPNLAASPFQSNTYNANSSFGQSPGNTSVSSYKFSHSLSSRIPTSQSSFSSPSNLHGYKIDDSAIVDDEDDDFNNDSGPFEDYVPGSLGDLILTPQELQRRASRSQSGTLLVRPNLNALLSLVTNEEEEVENLEVEQKVSVENKKHLDEKTSNEDVFLME